MLWIEPILLIFIAILLLFFFYAVVVSIIENEIRAAGLLFIFGLVLTLPLVILFLYFDAIPPLVVLSAPTFYALIILIFFAPVDTEKSVQIEKPDRKFDERDIMFSRRLLVPGSEKFSNYYNNNPDKKKLDDLFRAKPGLLEKGTIFYEPLLFNAAQASFDTVEAFHPIVDGLVSAKKVDVSKHELTVFIRKWAKKLGAKDVGFTLLKDYYKYSYVGRGKEYGRAVELDHKYAIAFTVEMDKALIDTAPKAPVTLETSLQYLESGEVAVQVASFLRRLGFEARAHIDGNYRLVCPLVARDAGLGNIGRMGLLMSPRQGPRLRIAVVSTNAPIEISEQKIDHSMTKFCRICNKCAAVCPAQAIPYGNETLIDGARRWQINQEKCFTYWCQAGTDCGRCIAVCPYAHPDNIFHNLVRYGIKYNPFFRRVAATMDDIFYGSKPKIKNTPAKIRVRYK